MGDYTVIARWNIYEPVNAKVVSHGRRFKFDDLYQNLMHNGLVVTEANGAGDLAAGLRKCRCCGDHNEESR